MHTTGPAFKLHIYVPVYLYVCVKAVALAGNFTYTLIRLKMLLILFSLILFRWQSTHYQTAASRRAWNAIEAIQEDDDDVSVCLCVCVMRVCVCVCVLVLSAAL